MSPPKTRWTVSSYSDHPTYLNINTVLTHFTRRVHGEASRFPVTSSLICIIFEVQAPCWRNQFNLSRWAAASVSEWTGATEEEDAGLQLVLRQRIPTKLREGRLIPRYFRQRPRRKEGATGWANNGANCNCQRFSPETRLYFSFWWGRWKWSLKALSVGVHAKRSDSSGEGGWGGRRDGGRTTRRGLTMLHVSTMFDS